MRYVRDLTAELLAETAPGVSTVPRLQPLHDEVFQLRSANREDEVRLDVRASNFWCKGQEAFFDIRVFLPDRPLLPPKGSHLSLPNARIGKETGVC